MPTFCTDTDHGHDEHVSLTCHAQCLTCNRLTALRLRFLLAAQSVLIAPLMAMPRTIRGPVFLFARSVQSRRLPLKHGGDWQDLEKAALSAELQDEAGPELDSIFGRDDIAGVLASHLHVQDISNASLVSRSMRHAILRGKVRTRREELCEIGCPEGVKSECWACTKVICEASYLLQ